MKIQLRDEIREYEKGTSVLEIAKSISEGLARVAVCGKIDGKLVDLSLGLENDCKLDIITNKDPEYKEVLRHTTAHILAQAVKSIYPNVKLSIGPATDDGYYYDFDFKTPITNEDLLTIEAEMKKIIKANFEITRKVVTKKQAIKWAKDEDEIYKLQIVEELEGNDPITMYTQGDFTDICRGPHLRSTGMVKAFKLTKMAGAYWRGDSKNKMLTRIYGVAFDKKSEMDEYFVRLEEAQKRDHRKLGKELGLFFISDYAKGMPTYMPKGLTLKNELIKYWREVHKRAGYVEIETPMAMNRELWETSGHWEHYKNNMYTFQCEDDTFAIKPMNCPGGMLYYMQQKHSYKEFPLRVGELGKVHRHEASGTLNGLLRVRCFTQDDAHIFMLPNQIESEVMNVIKLVDEVYSTFGLTYTVELSTMPESHIGEIEEWQMAEKALAGALEKNGLEYKINAGDGAFYGPKIDIHVKDCIGREWQCGTIQLDMQLPKRFNLTYTDSDGVEKEPIMIHRVIYGSMERMMSILIENYAGAFPLWLAPVQLKIINVSEKSEEYAKAVSDKFFAKGYRVENDFRSEKVGYKIRQAQLEKVPYMMVLGENEIQNNTVSLRKRNGEEIKDLSIEQVFEMFDKEIADKK